MPEAGRLCSRRAYGSGRRGRQAGSSCILGGRCWWLGFDCLERLLLAPSLRPSPSVLPHHALLLPPPRSAMAQTTRSLSSASRFLVLPLFPPRLALAAAALPVPSPSSPWTWTSPSPSPSPRTPAPPSSLSLSPSLSLAAFRPASLRRTLLPLPIGAKRKL